MLVPSLCVGSRPRMHHHPAPPRRDTGPWHQHGQPSSEVYSSGQTWPWCVLAPPRTPLRPAAPRFPLSLQNLLLRHQQPSGGPVPTQHRREGQPQLLLGPGKWGPWAALALLRVGLGSVEGGAGTQTPCSTEPRLLPGLLPLEQARRGAQEALPPHQPHPPHVPVLGHQPHHRHLGELWQGEWGGHCPVARPFRRQHPLHPLTQPDSPPPSAPRVIRWPCTWCGS